MRLVRIIPDTELDGGIGAGLYAVWFPGAESDELTRLFRLWTVDMEFLYAFFREQGDQLRFGYYSGISIPAAVAATRREAIALRRTLFAVAREGLSDGGKSLDSLFSSLDNAYGLHALQKSKLRGHAGKRWLRLYAIRFAEHCYVVTGGGIKLTRKMQEAPHLERELGKLDQTRQFLMDRGLLSQDDFTYLEL